MLLVENLHQFLRLLDEERSKKFKRRIEAKQRVRGGQVKSRKDLELGHILFNTRTLLSVHVPFYFNRFDQ